MSRIIKPLGVTSGNVDLEEYLEMIREEIALCRGLVESWGVAARHAQAQLKHWQKALDESETEAAIVKARLTDQEKSYG